MLYNGASQRGAKELFLFISCLIEGYITKISFSYFNSLVFFKVEIALHHTRNQDFG